MAFYNKHGGLLRQMHVIEVLIGGLSWVTDDQSLRDAFASFGEVDGKVQMQMVIVDRDSGRSRGFGFVNFQDEESAKEAMTTTDSQQPRAPRSGGFGGGSGGYGGQSRDNDGF
ncbi:hypothetical protein RND71_028515 [Anisodus tanguticus]|uniref:RRM domain-containing protein n=1 Tax=Anisodus tanguticus TaxID=243964 RepID=A0AAE1RLL4_9SOLA|nr:hypothetical protein RND71_028515 [Anisodus tanguticus]